MTEQTVVCSANSFEIDIVDYLIIVNKNIDNCISSKKYPLAVNKLRKVLKISRLIQLLELLEAAFKNDDLSSNLALKTRLSAYNNFFISLMYLCIAKYDVYISLIYPLRGVFSSVFEEQQDSSSHNTFELVEKVGKFTYLLALKMHTFDSKVLKRVKYLSFCCDYSKDLRDIKQGFINDQATGCKKPLIKRATVQADLQTNKGITSKTVLKKPTAKQTDKPYDKKPTVNNRQASNSNKHIKSQLKSEPDKSVNTITSVKTIIKAKAKKDKDFINQFFVNTKPVKFPVMNSIKKREWAFAFYGRVLPRMPLTRLA